MHDQCEYLIACLSGDTSDRTTSIANSLLLQSFQHCSNMSSHTISNSKSASHTLISKQSDAKVSAEYYDADDHDCVNSSNCVLELKQIFPDYGEAFLSACLTVFDESLDRTIDALLTVSIIKIYIYITFLYDILG